jgi:type IX secretion system PorP/SprF family membrane protein
MIKKVYQKTSVLIFILGLLWLTQPVYSQVTYLGSQFYENQYIGNPAMSGIEQGIVLNLSYRSQWRTLSGSPITQSFTAEYGKGQVGAGINIYNDKADLLGRQRAVGTYSYHLPLDYDSKKVHFGISLGVSNSTLDNDRVIGDTGDPLLDDYKRKPYLVGDFGVAYTSEKLTLQAALPNMKKYFEKDERNMIDRATFLMSISYKVALEVEGVYLEPRFGYRGAKGIDNILDIGSSINFHNNLLTAMGMYHSNKSFTLGFGLKLEDRYSINGYYTNQWTELSTSFGGNFEIGLRAHVFN